MCWPYSSRYPILVTEWMALVNDSADLSIDREHYGDPLTDPDRTYMIDWLPGDGVGAWFMCYNGEIKTKNPDDATIRRMIEMAGILDAWVTGDDSEVYSLAPAGQVINRQPTRSEIARSIPHVITRGSTAAGLNRLRPILRQEWMDLATAQPDFTIATEVDAHVPSGIKRIPCPPVAAWTGHPARPQVPFFFEEDLVEVQDADNATVHRMIELAAELDASVLDGNDNVVTW